MKGLRTLLFSLALTAIGLIEQSGALDLVPAKYVGLVVAAIGLITAALRMVTNTPVGKSNNLR